MILVNLLEISSGGAGKSLVYRLYSGDSEAEIKKKIVEGLQDSWEDYVRGVDKLDPSKPLREIVRNANKIIQDYMDEDYGDLTDYDLLVDPPYTDLGRAFDFYGDYHQVTESDDDDYEDVSFYFYGDYAMSLQEVFPYLSGLRSEYEVSISDEYVQRLSSLLRE
jgi:hypothetical protein